MFFLLENMWMGERWYFAAPAPPYMERDPYKVISLQQNYQICVLTRDLYYYAPIQLCECSSDYSEDFVTSAQWSSNWKKYQKMKLFIFYHWSYHSTLDMLVIKIKWISLKLDLWFQRKSGLKFDEIYKCQFYGDYSKIFLWLVNECQNSNFHFLAQTMFDFHEINFI